MIDLKNLDKLTPEQRTHFDALLEQFPHIKSKAGDKLNTPTKQELDPNDDLSYGGISSPMPEGIKHEEEIDYSSFQVPKAEPVERNPEDFSTIKVNEKSSLSLDQPPIVKEEDKVEVKPLVAPPVEEKAPNFSTEGKIHPVLLKMRAALGSRTGQLPVEVEIGGCIYGLQALDREAVANAISLAMSNTTNQTLYDANLETSIIASSIATIDKVPLIDLFSIPEKYEDGKIILNKQRKIMAAQYMFIELLASPNELVETLGIYYQQHFPALSLLEGHLGKFMCPVANCLQFRIADKGSDNYCPAHGDKMTEEDDLPNPS
jgi:hypothetical protein